MSKNLKFGMIFALACLLAFPAIVLASTYVIDTNDGVVDMDWASVSTTIMDGDDYADDNWDIDQAWVAVDDPNGIIYFRLSVLGKIPENGVNRVEAVIDCDRDGSVWGNDVIVYYPPKVDSESPAECQANDYMPTPSANYCNTYFDINPETYGEAISSTPTNYEWSADVLNNTNVNWATCTGSARIKFYTSEFSSSDGRLVATHDSTGWLDMNIPTSMTVQKIAAQTGVFANPAIPVFLFLAACAILGTGWMIRRSH